VGWHLKVEDIYVKTFEWDIVLLLALKDLAHYI
jgi:hypothetical protein